MERFQRRKDWSVTPDQKGQELNDHEKRNKIINNSIIEIRLSLSNPNISKESLKPFKFNRHC